MLVLLDALPLSHEQRGRLALAVGASNACRAQGMVEDLSVGLRETTRALQEAGIEPGLAGDFLVLMAEKGGHAFPDLCRKLTEVVGQQRAMGVEPAFLERQLTEVLGASRRLTGSAMDGLMLFVPESPQESQGARGRAVFVPTALSEPEKPPLGSETSTTPQESQGTRPPSRKPWRWPWS